MTTQERLLYQQIHPLKMVTDLVCGVAALYLLWYHWWVLAFAIYLLFPLAASIVVVSLFKLEPLRDSALGQYVKQYLTFPVEMTRSAGMAAMAVGAWLHQPLIIVVGAVVYAGAWINGLIFPE